MEEQNLTIKEDTDDRFTTWSTASPLKPFPSKATPYTNVTHTERGQPQAHPLPGGTEAVSSLQRGLHVVVRRALNTDLYRMIFSILLAVSNDSFHFTG